MQATTRLAQRSTRDNNILASRFFSHLSRYRVRNRVQPRGADVGNIDTHSGRINLRCRSQSAHDDRHVVATTLAVSYVGEQKCRSFRLRDPTLELPADERVKFRILVDQAINAP